MALANALADFAKEREDVIRMFLDESDEAPFSIRNILKKGEETVGKQAGEWYGAHSITQVLSELTNTEELPLKILSFNEGLVYENVLIEEAERQPVMVMIPLRIGLDTVDDLYIPQI